MKYVAPSYSTPSFTCPHCGTLSLMNYEIHNYQDATYIGKSSQTIISQANNWIRIATCLTCLKKTIWINNTYVYPEIQQENPHEDMPDSVKQLYVEAASICNKSPRAACALLRLAVDKLCRELGENDRDINTNIANLVRNGLPVRVQKALDVVRVVGNKAVHPGQISFDVDDINTATMLMRLVNMIVERMIHEPKVIDDLFDALPDSVKESVAQRDRK